MASLRALLRHFGVFLGLGLAGAPVAAEQPTVGEVIEIEGCPAHASFVESDAPDAVDGFVCECDAGFVDADPASSVECQAFQWADLLGFAIEPVCTFVPSICNGGGGQGGPGSQGEADECEKCDDARARCDIFVVGPERIFCEDAAAAARGECLGAGLLACTQAGETIGTGGECETRARADCTELYLDERGECEADRVAPLEDRCESENFDCVLEHCLEVEDPEEGSGFDSGLSIGDAAAAIGGALGAGLGGAEPQQQLFVAVQTPIAGPPDAPVVPVDAAPTPIEAGAQVPDAPCTHCGDVLELVGRQKTRIARVGKQKRLLEMGIRITETGLFEAMDLGGHVVVGEWEAANRRGTKLDLTIDPGYVPSFEAMVRAAARELDRRADAVEAPGPVVLRLKLRRDGSVAAKLRAKFTADVGGVERRGRFHVQLEGR